MNQAPIDPLSPNKSYMSMQGQTNTLGLEKHVKHIFMQTQNTIETLNEELENQKKVNEDLQWKLTDLNSQKSSLQTKTKNLEQELRDQKIKVEDLLKKKNDFKSQIQIMRKELQNINDDWENKRKELLHQINQQREQQIQLEDERNREKIAFEQASRQYQQKIESITNSIRSTNAEIAKYQGLIAKLKEREKFSMDTIMNETFKFKEFLESQVPDNVHGSGMEDLNKLN
ncbi:hypothetical protein ABPG72_016783 [Tetrahymena utriculariae]